MTKAVTLKELSAKAASRAAHPWGLYANELGSGYSRGDLAASDTRDWENLVREELRLAEAIDQHLAGIAHRALRCFGASGLTNRDALARHLGSVDGEPTGGLRKPRLDIWAERDGPQPEHIGQAWEDSRDTRDIVLRYGTSGADGIRRELVGVPLAGCDWLELPQVHPGRGNELARLRFAWWEFEAYPKREAHFAARAELLGSMEAGIRRLAARLLQVADVVVGDWPLWTQHEYGMTTVTERAELLARNIDVPDKVAVLDRPCADPWCTCSDAGRDALLDESEDAADDEGGPWVNPF